MPLKWKVDVLAALKEKGYTSYVLRKNKALSESTIQKLREGRGIAWEGVEQLCELLHCQPGDLIEFVED